MRRILFFIATSFMLASCSMDSTNKSSFPLLATFDYTDLSRDQTFQKDSIFFNKLYIDDKNQSALGWGNYIGFLSKLNDGKIGVSGGFILSGFSGKVTEGSVETPYRSADTSIVNNNYLVYIQKEDTSVMPEQDFIFSVPEYGTCNPLVCYVTNTTDVVESVKENFVVGDKMILSATGYLQGAKTGKAEIVLAECNAVKDSIVTSWTKFDLSKLGNVDNVDFEIISSKADVPAYFCLDDFYAYIILEY